MTLTPSEAIGVLNRDLAKIDAGAATRLDHIIADREREATVSDAIAALGSQPLAPGELSRLKDVADRLRERRDAERRERVARLIGDQEAVLVRLLNEANALAGKSAEQKSALVLTAEVTIRHGFTLASALADAKRGSSVANAAARQIFESRVSVRDAHGDIVHTDSAGILANDVRKYLTPAAFPATVEWHLLAAKLREIDHITGEFNKQGLKDEDIFAFLESKHECLRG